MTSDFSIDRLRQLLDLDATTGVLRWRESRGSVAAGTPAGSYDDRGYLRVRVDKRFLKVHRVVFALTHGYRPVQVDHRNGVLDDNRPDNLRDATCEQNQRNAKVRIDNSTGVKGVSWHASSGRWQAQCSVNGKQKTIGRYDTIEAAEAAVRAFREQHHGEFARHE